MMPVKASNPMMMPGFSKLPPTTANGESLPDTATTPAKATPKRLSPTMKPVAPSTPIRLTNSGFFCLPAHFS